MDTWPAWAGFWMRIRFPSIVPELLGRFLLQWKRLTILFHLAVSLRAWRNSSLKAWLLHKLLKQFHRLSLYQFRTSWKDNHLSVIVRENPSSETQGLLAGTMRYFRAKVYLMCWRAPGNLFLPNQFQKWSNSVPLIGQKNIFLPNQRGALAGWLCRLLTRSSFLHRSPDLLAWPVQRNGKVVVESFRKKYSTKPRKSQALTWELGTNTLPSIFSAGLSELYRKCL